MTQADQAVWLDVISYLRENHPDMCRQWFEDLSPLGTDGGVFRVRVDQPIRKRYLENQCEDNFTEAVQSVTGRLLSVRFCSPDEQPVIQTRTAHMPSRRAAQNGAAAVGAGAPAPERGGSQVIVPDYTFENFIVGRENHLAHAAAIAVCENVGTVYNPLFIHGGVGLGKTHLLQAVCQRVLERAPDRHVLYVSCESFMTQFMESVQAGQMAEFRHRFRDVDVLVIDDIQFLAKRDRTQEEFFHTFNDLYQSSKQIVLSADSEPQDIPDLESRLVSRFQSGLVVEMGTPSYETRVQIVKQKASIRGITLPEEVACLIANCHSESVRELEGAIMRVHHACKGRVTLEGARQALGPVIRKRQNRETTITSIIDMVVDYYGVKLSDLQSKRRQKSIAHPRQVCMYLARKHTRYSLEEIGGYFGGRDHTTVMHAVKTIQRRREEDEGFDQVLCSFEERFRMDAPEPVHA